VDASLYISNTSFNAREMNLYSATPWNLVKESYNIYTYPYSTFVSIDVTYEIPGKELFIAFVTSSTTRNTQLFYTLTYSWRLPCIDCSVGSFSPTCRGGCQQCTN
jgi:hypothetical protein